ncbi:hypothetical protein PCE1_000046 [Barthelona sp. PCE]
MSRISLKPIVEYMHSQVEVELTNGQRISGILKGYDDFTNLTLFHAHEILTQQEGGVIPLGNMLLRGNQIVWIERQT